MSKQTKYTKSAKGQECQIRLPGVCNFDTETTVLAHLNGGGMGMKALDIHGAYACSRCHDAVDGRIAMSMMAHSSREIKLAFYDGVIRTQSIMIIDGVLAL